MANENISNQLIRQLMSNLWKVKSLISKHYYACEATEDCVAVTVKFRGDGNKHFTAVGQRL